MSTQPDFHLDYPWYRRHDAQLIELLAAQWGGVRVELVTREAVGPCDGGMCVPHHVVSFLTEGRRSGVINSIEGSTPRRVGHDAGWTRIVPAGCHVHTHWERGRRTYLMAFIEPQHLQTLGDTYGVTVSQDLQEQVDVRDQRLARVLGDMSQELREPGLLSEVLGLAMAEQFCVQLLRLMQQQSAKLPMARGGLATRPLALVLEMIEQGLDGGHQGLGDRHLEIGEVDRLGEKIERAAIHRGADIGHILVINSFLLASQRIVHRYKTL